MPKNLIALAALLVASLLPQASRAQEGEAAAPIDDRAAYKVNDVERGVFFGVEAGGGLLFGPKGQAPSGKGMTTARTLGVSLGYDIGELASIGVMAMGMHADTPAGFTSTANKPGDFSSLVLGATGRFFLVGPKDENGVKRLFVYLRGGAGLALIGPKEYYEGNDILVMGGAGLEYFTHLRHFSIGLDADAVMGLSHMGFGMIVSPSLRYSF